MIICTGEKNAALSRSLHGRKAQLFNTSARELVKISQNLSKSLINARVSPHSRVVVFIYNKSTTLEPLGPICTYTGLYACGLNSVSEFSMDIDNKDSVSIIIYFMIRLVIRGKCASCSQPSYFLYVSLNCAHFLFITPCL